MSTKNEANRSPLMIDFRATIEKAVPTIKLKKVTLHKGLSNRGIRLGFDGDFLVNDGRRGYRITSKEEKAFKAAGKRFAKKYNFSIREEVARNRDGESFEYFVHQPYRYRGKTNVCPGSFYFVFYYPVKVPGLN